MAQQAAAMQSKKVARQLDKKSVQVAAKDPAMELIFDSPIIDPVSKKNTATNEVNNNKNTTTTEIPVVNLSSVLLEDAKPSSHQTADPLNATDKVHKKNDNALLLCKETIKDASANEYVAAATLSHQQPSLGLSVTTDDNLSPQKNGGATESAAAAASIAKPSPTTLEVEMVEENTKDTMTSLTGDASATKKKKAKSLLAMIASQRNSHHLQAIQVLQKRRRAKSLLAVIASQRKYQKRKGK